MIKKANIFLFLFFSISLYAQNFSIYQFSEKYENYKEHKISERRISHALIDTLAEEFAEVPDFDVKLLGRSINGNGIYLFSVGRGETKVLAWSQMHGDESTASMAVFDLFNFFRSDDEFNEFRENLFDSLTIYFIPMLNPDGAEKFTRRNALQIDINRDALRLQSPESKILKSVRDSLNPQFGFNLHDQGINNASGKSFKSAALSFLAPAYNYEKDINEVRSNTMKLIVNLNDELSKLIPGHIGRYSDDFEPRAFGDNMVKWGTSSVLIESGGWLNDTEKQFIRKLNFCALLTGFQSIANKYYVSADITKYEQIPENEKLLFDLIIRNAMIEVNGDYYTVDIGIKREQKNSEDNRSFSFVSSVEDLGDLSIFYGYREIDASGMIVVPGKVYPEKINSIDEIYNLDQRTLYYQGYLTVRYQSSGEEKFCSTPNKFNLSLNEDCSEHPLKLGSPANFLLQKNGEFIYAVVNGFIYDFQTGSDYIKNTMILK